MWDQNETREAPAKIPLEQAIARMSELLELASWANAFAEGIGAFALSSPKPPQIENCHHAPSTLIATPKFHVKHLWALAV